MDMIRKKIWDALSITLILGVLLTIIWQPFFLRVIFEDTTYHLLVAENFIRAGGIVTHDFWESLPEGRPHNYPPLFHVLTSIGLLLTQNPPLVANLISGLGIIASLTLLWIGLRLLINPAVAFWAIAILTSFVNYLIFLGVITPASLVLASTPLLIYLITNRKVIGATSLLTMMFYTHMLIPWLVVGSIGIWILLYERSLVRTGGIVLLSSVILYSPWLVNIIADINYIKYINESYISHPKEHITSSTNSNLLVTILIIPAIAYLWLKSQTNSNLRYWKFFLILALVQVPIIYSNFPSRFLSSGGYLAMAIILAIAIWQIGRNFTTAKKAIFYFLIIIVTQLGYIEMTCWKTNSTWNCSRGIMPGLIYQAALLRNEDAETKNLISRYDAYTKTNLGLVGSLPHD